MSKVTKGLSKKILLLLALVVGFLSPKQLKADDWGLYPDQRVIQNGNVVEGQAAKALFHNPETNDVWIVGTSGSDSFRWNGSEWEQGTLPEDMSGYFAVSASGGALTDEQIDALVSAGCGLGNLVTSLQQAEQRAKEAEEAAQQAEQAAGQAADDAAAQEQVTPLTEEEKAKLAAQRKEAIEQGRIHIGGLTATNELFRRVGIKDGRLEGKTWKEVHEDTGLYELPGFLQQISVNGLGHTWAVNNTNQVMFKTSLADNDDWEPVFGDRVQVVCNNHDHVWSVDPDGNIFIRTGISDVDPNGADWAQVDGAAQFLAINDNNQLYAVGTDGNLYMRDGIDENNHAGTGWTPVDGPSGEGALRSVSINNDGQIWVITADSGSIYVRSNEKWTEVAGKLQQVVATKGGAWGVDEANKVFFREGVTAENASGTGWEGPVNGNMNFIFASGAELEKPELDDDQKQLKKKKRKHRVAKLKKRLKKLKKKVKKAKGAKKRKLRRKIKNTQRKIRRLRRKAKSSKKKRNKKRKKKKKKKRKKKKKKKRKKKKKKKRKKKKKKKRKKKKKKKRKKKKKKKRKKKKKKKRKKKKKKKRKKKKKKKRKKKKKKKRKKKKKKKRKKRKKKKRKKRKKKKRKKRRKKRKKKRRKKKQQDDEQEESAE